jgi:hypothetical protein
MYAAVQETIGRGGWQCASVLHGNTTTDGAARLSAHQPVRDESANTVRIARTASKDTGRTTAQAEPDNATRTRAQAASDSAASASTRAASNNTTRTTARTTARAASVDTAPISTRSATP